MDININMEELVIKSHSCYILYNQNGLTYNGYTVNFKRRIRQHNGEIKGGARYTQNITRRPWNYLLTVESNNFNNHIALSFEYYVKKPTGKRRRPKEYCGIHGRIKSIPLVLANPKFFNMNIHIKIIPQYLELLQELCITFPNVIVSELIDI